MIAVTAGAVALCGVLTARAAAVPPGPNGPIAFSGLVGNSRQVFVVNPDGSFLSQVTDDPLGAGAIVWFPDGRRLAYMTLHSAELKVLDIQTGEIRSAVSSDLIASEMFIQAPDSTPRWSPDGTRVAYVSGSGALSQVLVADRSGARVNVVASAGWGLDPDWSPDGARIVFSNTSGLHTVGPDGSGSARLLAPPSGSTVTHSDPSWSPDGGRIAFLSYDVFSGGQSQIQVVNRDGSLPTPVGAGGELDNPTWSPDGSRIGFSRGFGQAARLWTMRPDGSDARPLVGDTGPDRGTTRLAWGTGPILTRTLLPVPTVARLRAAVARELAQARRALVRCGTTGLLKKNGCRDSFAALGPGTLVYRVTSRAESVRAVAVIASGRKAIPAAGRYPVKVKATKRARKRLRKTRKLRARLTVTFSDSRGNVAKRSTKVVLQRKTK